MMKNEETRRKSEEEAALHAGHRLRVKERFLRDGLDGFEPHVVLEMLLYYTVPQGTPIRLRIVCFKNSALLTGFGCAL